MTTLLRFAASARGWVAGSVLLWSIVAASLALPATVRAADVQKRVLVLYSNRNDMPANVLVDRLLRSVLEREFGILLDFNSEYLDPFQMSDEEFREALRDFIRRKYAGRRFDLVIGVARTALSFIQDYGDELFPHTPVVAYGGRDVVTRWGSSLPLTGVLEKRDFGDAVEFVLRVQPDLEQLFVVSGSSQPDRRRELDARSQLQRFEHRISIRYLAGLRVERVFQHVSRLSESSAVLFLSMDEDGGGRSLRRAEIVEQIVRHATVPVYGISATQLGSGIVGGVLFDPEVLGRETAELAGRALLGERVQDIPVRESVRSIVPMIDRRAFRRWGLDEARLPVSTVVRYKVPSLWELYTWQLIGAIALCVTEGALIIGLLVQRAKRRQAELEVRLQQRELAHLGRVATLGELSGALAHELSQPLTSIMSNAQAALRFLNREPLNVLEARDSLKDIVVADKRAGEVIQHMRVMLKGSDTQAQSLDINDLLGEVLELARADLLARRVVVTTRLTPDLPRVDGDRVQLQQVLLNLILNACDAMSGIELDKRELTAATRTEEGWVHVSVTDRGPGISTHLMPRIFEPFFTSKDNGLGLGLAICRSIIRAHHGRIWVSNNALGGATFFVSLPMPGKATASVRSVRAAQPGARPATAS